MWRMNTVKSRLEATSVCGRDYWSWEKKWGKWTTEADWIFSRCSIPSFSTIKRLDLHIFNLQFVISADWNTCLDLFNLRHFKMLCSTLFLTGGAENSILSLASTFEYSSQSNSNSIVHYPYSTSSQIYILLKMYISADKCQPLDKWIHAIFSSWFQGFLRSDS